MTTRPKQILKLIEQKTRTQADIARECGISESYLSLIKYGKRKLNPDNKHHQRILTILNK